MSLDTLASSTAVSRRQLLRFAGVLGGVAAIDASGLRHSTRRAEAAPPSSSWSNPATWEGKKVPGPLDTATISTAVVLDIDTKVAGVVVKPGASLTFAPTRSLKLESTGNVVVDGTLTMRPTGSSVHQLVFTGVNEEAYVGGGMDPVATDVGLWVVNDGRLDVAGPAKTAWTRLAGDGLQGETILQLDRVPSGWSVGDRVAVSPTLPNASPGTSAWTGFSEGTVTALSGSRVTISAPLAYNHKKVGGVWAAEVLNLTRAVRIEGTPTGRAHVFIRSTAAQAISHATLRYMGPRKGGAKVLGRWPLHLHHCGEGSRGVALDGLVVSDTGSHAFAVHESHGITLRNSIAYNVEEHAFWWDSGDSTNDAVWESCVAARVKTTDFSVSGFYLGKGTGNIIRDCVAIGAEGASGAGIMSPAKVDNGTWTIEDCLAHNNRHAGFKAYINTDHTDSKVVSRLVAYHNRAGIDHGAYLNSFLYEGCTLFGNVNGGVQLRAVSNSQGLRFVGTTFDGAGLAAHGVVNANHVSPGQYPTVFESCTFRGHTVSGLGLIVPDPAVADLIDLVACVFEGNELWLASDVLSGCTIRIQDVAHGSISVKRSDQPGVLVPAWNGRMTTIAPFA